MNARHASHLTVLTSTPTRFRALLRSLTQAAIVSGVAGCSASHSETGDWDPIACNQGGSLRDVKTTRPVDYLAIYRQYTDNLRPPTDGGAPSWTFQVAATGSPCTGAASVSECEADLAQITSCDGTCGPFLITGTGGTLERLDSRAEVLKLLGDVDAVADALWLAMYDDHTICSGIDYEGKVRSVSNGFETRSSWEECGVGIFDEELSIAGDGKVEQQSYEKTGDSLCAIGRRPFGLCESLETPHRAGIGAYLSQAAHLEAASVYAFQKLVEELMAFDAPKALIDAAIDAIEDELAHTRDVARLARAYGASTALPEVAPTPLRSKLEVALDNISEGCVRETFGAAVATYQAECASDPRVRAVMRKIAEDETQHARFSWELQAWLAGELSEDEAKLVEAEKTRAMQLLAQAFESGLEPAEDRALGFPSVEAARSLFSGLSQTLWRVPA